MKTTKTSAKIILSAIAFALVFAATCVITFASGTAPVTPEIISKNVSFDDNLHLYYAVPTAGIEKENITLKVYEDAEGSVELQTPRTPVLNKDDGSYVYDVNGTDCYIFRTIGIAPKEADKTIYVQAVNTVDGEEYKSDIVAYNIITYLSNIYFVIQHQREKYFIIDFKYIILYINEILANFICFCRIAIC
jgi:hypothetical protein